jgi:cation:H+ antiporter
VVALIPPILYAAVIWVKDTLNLWDAAVLIAIYVAYLMVLRRMPTAGEEGVDELESIPRRIVQAPRATRIAAITALFVVGGGLIYFCAEPFLASLLALSTTIGIPNFVFVQWVAPFVSEFPEKVSAFFWARTVDRASIALMNMVSSNINQWTLLAAMLPIVYCISVGSATSIVFDQQQEFELLMTIGQALLACTFLLNMKLTALEAGGLFGLWLAQFAISPITPGPGFLGFLSKWIDEAVTTAYFGWAAVEVIRMVITRKAPEALRLFGVMWRRHVR